MNQFLKILSLFLLLITCQEIVAQDNVIYVDKKEKFKPTLILSSGLYTLNGDIENSNKGLLKGVSGYSTGIKFDVLNNIDVSFSLLKTAFSANNNIESFSSELDGVALDVWYEPKMRLKLLGLRPIISIGMQSLGVKTIIDGVQQDRSSALNISQSIGCRMNMSERVQFDVSLNFGMGLSDIDMSVEGGNDGYRSLNFTIHYDLFSSSNKNSLSNDNSYYDDVNFEQLESEDEDSDLVLDFDDYCPGTPLGVRVDKNGCPLDDDNDGIPNFIDQQKDTPKGSIVDEFGVMLTIDKYKSVYTDYEIATRKYANFYNEIEIEREDYKTIDEYLIARANAFNRAYNESLNDNLNVQALIYKVKIGEFIDLIPAKIQNQLLSFDDLESFTMNNDIVIYSVGSYNSLQEAMIRKNTLDERGFDDTDILIDNNGNISKYVPYIPKNPINENELVEIVDSIASNNNPSVKKTSLNSSSTIYRIQLGAAFNSPLPDAVFKGVDNLLSFTGKDGWIRYMAGSFIDYIDAINYQAQMQARGFSDAFIVTFKNGKRIGLDVAIKNNNKVLDNTNKLNNKSLDLSFTVQVMVSEGLATPQEVEMMNKIGKFNSNATGSDMYEYYVGTYKSLKEAEAQLERAREYGFRDAFIFANKNNERISLNVAKKLLNKNLKD